MKKRLLSLVLLLSAAIVISALAACNNGNNAADAPTESATAGETTAAVQALSAEFGVMHDEESGGIYLLTGVDDFNALGFEYGDSVNVEFTNGYKLSDLPYYNAFYSRIGDPMLLGYSGYGYIKAGINAGADLWDVAGLSDEAKATVTLAESGKYLDIQNARNISYTNDRDSYESDEMFANFRAVKAGNIKADTLFRSSSPIDAQIGRASYADRLMGESGVKYVIDLADKPEWLQIYIGLDDFDSPNIKRLYDNDCIYAAGLDFNIASDDFRENVVNAARAIAEHDGPYLIHCTEGKDRTGFVCILLEALCGASYDEMVNDYMQTYYNYYHIDKDSEKYPIIVSEVFDPMLGVIVGDTDADLKTADHAACAESFLADGGMSEDEIAQLKAKLS